MLLVNGKPDRVKEVLRPPTTLREFAPRFLEGHAKANRLKASGIASKECALRIHLVPALGDKPLAAITTEDVQQLKSALSARSPKTVNNILTVLTVLTRTAGSRGWPGRRAVDSRTWEWFRSGTCCAGSGSR